ncbi:MAG TPA: sugar ABC transporter permease [Candidatus Limnocylindrales bacterium]|nr:sugar ABC transporter permease [Candidatus Limnocylindrales bacterium]
MAGSSRMGRLTSLLWIAPALILLVLFVYYPVVDNVRLSLYRWNAFSPDEVWVGLDNYTTLFKDPIFWSSLFNNVAYAVVSVVFQVGGGLVLAAILEELVRGRLQGVFRTIYFIPAVLSLTITGLLFQFMYNPQIGLVNGLLDVLGLDAWKHSWLGESATAIWAIIAMSQWQSVGYVMVLFIVAMQRIPRELYEAAYIDGASRTRAFRSITLPLVREMTLLAMIITISGAFLVFNEVQVMTAGGPNNASHTLGTWLYKSAFFNDKMGYAAAIAVVIFMITVVTSVIQLVLNRGKTVQY